MKFYRLYSGADGQSHFEPLDSSRASEFFNSTRTATGLLFRNDFAPHIVDYHRAPRRRWVITLSGSVDIDVGQSKALALSEENKIDDLPLWLKMRLAIGAGVGATRF